MEKFKQTIFICAAMTSFAFALSKAVKAQESITIKAQEASIIYTSRMEIFDATEPPKIIGLPKFQYPESARKNGVEGKMKVSLTLAKNGTVHDIAVEQSLPHGVTEAITNELKQLRFQPAEKNGEPVDAKMFFEFAVSVIYNEKDKNISKPTVIEKPEAVYPENQKAQAVKGKVYVSVLLSADGSVQILGVRSAMPQEFNQAATEAAKKIKFQPAVHKTSKSKVSQKMTVEYNFKP